MREEPHSPAFPADRLVAGMLRAAHLAAVVGLGAALLGAALRADHAAWAVVVTGVGMLALDLWAGRIDLREAAGWVVIGKLLAMAGAASLPHAAGWLFWALVVLSALSAHAPKRVRHWRPGRGGAHQQRASKADSPG